MHRQIYPSLCNHLNQNLSCLRTYLPRVISEQVFQDVYVTEYYRLYMFKLGNFNFASSQAFASYKGFLVIKKTNRKTLGFCQTLDKYIPFLIHGTLEYNSTFWVLWG